MLSRLTTNNGFVSIPLIIQINDKKGCKNKVQKQGAGTGCRNKVQKTGCRNRVQREDPKWLDEAMELKLASVAASMDKRQIWTPHGLYDEGPRLPSQIGGAKNDNDT